MFNSNVLTEAASKNSLDNSIMEESNFFTKLLEFNDEMQQIEYDYEYKRYRSLKEYAEICSNSAGASSVIIDKNIKALEESMIEDFKNKVINAIQAIIDFVKKIIASLTQKDLKIRNSFKASVSRTKGFQNVECMANNYVFYIHHYLPISEIDDSRARNAIVGLTQDIMDICNGISIPATSDSSLEVAYKSLAKAVKQSGSSNNGVYKPRNEFDQAVENSTTFANFVRTDIIYKERLEMSYEGWRSIIEHVTSDDKSIINRKLSNIKSDLEKCKEKIASTTIVDDVSKKNVNQLISQMKAIISSYTWFLNANYDAETVNLRYIMNTYERIKNKTNVSESGLIHGEEFDSNTLFANKDLNDFNRTEWLDLSLTSECFMMKQLDMESKRKIAIKEALILSDNDPLKFKRLVAMREAEESDLKSKARSIIDRIREIVEQFISKMKDRNFKDVKFLNRNSQFISNNIKIAKIVSAGDIFAGLYRVQKPMNIIPYNAESMKDDLTDKRVFFEKHILPGLQEASTYAKRQIKWDNDISIADYCKAYFGASMPKDKFQECVFTGKDVQDNKENMIKFLNKPNVLQSINNDLNKLDNEFKKAKTQESKQPDNNATNNTQNNNASNEKPNDNEEAKHESMYYSELYGRYFTEAEIEMDNTQPASSTDNGNGTSDNSKSSSGIKVYMDAYKDVLMAKLTAAEFIQSEFMQIIMAHAKSYMNADQKAAEAEEAKK